MAVSETEAQLQRTNTIMASLIVHLAEYIETGEPLDLQAAEGLSMLGDVYDEFKRLHNLAMLPQTRKPVKFIERMLDA